MSSKKTRRYRLPGTDDAGVPQVFCVIFRLEEDNLSPKRVNAQFLAAWRASGHAR